jgi:signal transduction histidine kinase/ABC-type uncharacterized transport system substrate-binding protein
VVNIERLSCNGKTIPTTARQSGIAALIFSLTVQFAMIGTGQAQTNANVVHHHSPLKRVLLLFSAGPGAPGSIMMEQAIEAEMQSHSAYHYEFFTERQDVSHFSDLRHQRLFQDYLGRKYAGRDLDLIIAVPSRDYTLARELPDALFPEVPVVFASVNELDVPTDIGKYGVTGIIQRFDLAGTIGLMVRLQPEKRRLVVIGGISESDRATLARVDEVTRGLEGIHVEFWTNRPVAGLQAAVKDLPPDAVILLSSIQSDVTGQALMMSQVGEMLAPVASVPMYVLGSPLIGAGAVGGSVVDVQDLGVRTADLSLRVLDGADPQSLPIQVETKGTPMVDWRELQRWHIKESRLPAECEVRFRPPTLWGQHRDIILISLTVILAQAVTIAGLLTQRRQRRLAETKILSQRAELAHVSRVSTMGQLASALAHELNQPLGAILRNAEAGEMFLQKEKPDLNEIRAILSDIRKDDERAGNVIGRMRSLLRRRSLESNALDLRGVVEEIVTLARSDASKRRVHLTAEFDANLPIVRGDRVHLQQVMLNLILNGMDAMGKLPPAERRLEIHAYPLRDGGAEVAVRDLGTGIPEDKLDRVFEPFFTTKTEGMGMGLAISRTIIEAHGGKIRAENNLTGKGATFFVTFPANNNS